MCDPSHLGRGEGGGGGRGLLDTGHKAFLSFNIYLNWPFPSSLVSLFQSESKCETILMKITLICMKIKLHAEFIST